MNNLVHCHRKFKTYCNFIYKIHVVQLNIFWVEFVPHRNLLPSLVYISEDQCCTMANVRCQKYLFIGLILFIGTGIAVTFLWEYYIGGKRSINAAALLRSAGNMSMVESRKRWSNVTYNKKPLTSLINIRHAHTVNKSDLKLKQDRITVLYFNEWLANINRSGFNTNDGKCPYLNCYFTHNISLFNKSTAVIFDLRGDFTIAPPSKKPGQIWIFSTMESPLNNYNYGLQWRHLNWRNKVNWTSNYR